MSRIIIERAVRIMRGGPLRPREIVTHSSCPNKCSKETIIAGYYEATASTRCNKRKAEAEAEARGLAKAEHYTGAIIALLAMASRYYGSQLTEKAEAGILFGTELAAATITRALASTGSEVNTGCTSTAYAESPPQVYGSTRCNCKLNTAISQESMDNKCSMDIFELGNDIAIIIHPSTVASTVTQSASTVSCINAISTILSASSLAVKTESNISDDSPTVSYYSVSAAAIPAATYAEGTSTIVRAESEASESKLHASSKIIVVKPHYTVETVIESTARAVRFYSSSRRSKVKFKVKISSGRVSEQAGPPPDASTECGPADHFVLRAYASASTSAALAASFKQRGPRLAAAAVSSTAWGLGKPDPTNVIRLAVSKPTQHILVESKSIDDLYELMIMVKPYYSLNVAAAAAAALAVSDSGGVGYALSTSIESVSSIPSAIVNHYGRITVSEEMGVVAAAPVVVAATPDALLQLAIAGSESVEEEAGDISDRLLRLEVELIAHSAAEVAESIKSMSVGEAVAAAYQLLLSTKPLADHAYEAEGSRPYDYDLLAKSLWSVALTTLAAGHALLSSASVRAIEGGLGVSCAALAADAPLTYAEDAVRDGSLSITTTNVLISSILDRHPLSSMMIDLDGAQAVIKSGPKRLVALSAATSPSTSILVGGGEIVVLHAESTVLASAYSEAGVIVGLHYGGSSYSGVTSRGHPTLLASSTAGAYACTFDEEESGSTIKPVVRCASA